MTLETSWVSRDMYNRSKKWNRIELAICLKFKIDIYVLPNFQILLKVQVQYQLQHFVSVVWTASVAFAGNRRQVARSSKIHDIPSICGAANFRI